MLQFYGYFILSVSKTEKNRVCMAMRLFVSSIWGLLNNSSRELQGNPDSVAFPELCIKRLKLPRDQIKPNKSSTSYTYVHLFSTIIKLISRIYGVIWLHGELLGYISNYQYVHRHKYTKAIPGPAVQYETTCTSMPVVTYISPPRKRWAHSSLILSVGRCELS